MNLAPIALLAYNRPRHFRQTVETLEQDPLAGRSDLWVFCDAPANSREAAAVAAVRAVAKTTTGFQSIVVVEQDRNLGLAASVMSSVTKLCEQYGRVIVLEDDLTVAPGFLEYLNHALTHYADEPTVMQISGYMFPVQEPDELPQTFLSALPTSWGWGTWSRAWRQFEPDSRKLLDRIRAARAEKSFDIDGSYSYFSMLEACANGELDVWGVRWYASMFLNSGLCLYPRRSLVRNNGMDGSGVHCGRTGSYDVEFSPGIPREFPSSITELALGRRKISDFFARLRMPWYRQPLKAFKEKLRTW